MTDFTNDEEALAKKRAELADLFKPPPPKLFPPDPDAGYVRPHAAIHDDLLRANIEIYELKLRIAELEREKEVKAPRRRMPNLATESSVSVEEMARLGSEGVDEEPLEMPMSEDEDDPPIEAEGRVE